MPGGGGALSRVSGFGWGEGVAAGYVMEILREWGRGLISADDTFPN